MWIFESYVVVWIIDEEKQVLPVSLCCKVLTVACALPNIERGRLTFISGTLFLSNKTGAHRRVRSIQASVEGKFDFHVNARLGRRLYVLEISASRSLNLYCMSVNSALYYIYTRFACFFLWTWKEHFQTKNIFWKIRIYINNYHYSLYSFLNEEETSSTGS